MYSRTQEKQPDYHFPPFNPVRVGRDVGFTVQRAGNLRIDNIIADRKTSREVEIIYGDPLIEESKALLLLDDKMGEQVLSYFTNSFLLEGLGTFLNLRREQHDRDRDEFVRRHPNDFALLYAQRSHRIMDRARRYYNMANSTSLFQRVPHGAIQINQLVDTQLPLSATATKKISILFENAIDTDDIQEAILFSTLYRMQETDIDEFVQTHLPRKQTEIYGDSIIYSFKQIRRRVIQYLDHYHRELEQGTFDTTDYGRSILPALVATTYVSKLKFFPLVTEDLLQQAVGADMSEVLSICYEEKYVHSVPNPSLLGKTLEDSASNPYVMYWQTFQADNVESAIVNIAEVAKITAQPEETKPILNEQTVKELIRFVRGGILEVGRIGNVTLSISSSIEHTLDVFLTLPDQETVCLQVINGHPFGILQDSEELENLIALVLAKVNNFAQQNIPSLHQRAESPLQPTDTRRVTPQRRDRRELISPPPLPRKRKAQRAAVDQPLHTDGNETIAKEKAAATEKYDVTVVDRYSDALNKLPPPNKRAAQEALLEWRKGQENRRAKWLAMSSKSSDITVYSLRPDDLNRIILVHLIEDTPEIFYVFDIGPRRDDIIYDRTERLLKSGAIKRIIEREKQKLQNQDIRDRQS